ncbi:MAG: hypothetical protein GX610_00540 [Rhodococcus sp.]|nr:hypothetical protein [Rhodococcus sp. (in: high G+C Gram-positive bacteria)]
MFDGEIASTGFCVLRPSKAIDSRFLYFTVTRQAFLDEVIAKQRGVSYPAVRPAEILEVPIPLPPLPEQHRIVEVLEDHLSRLDAVERVLEEARVKMRRMRAQHLTAALRSRELIASSTIGDECEVFVGTTPSRANPKLWNGDLPWVSSGEVAFNRIATTRERISREAAGNARTRIHPPGTVMIAMIGEGKTRGQVAILDIEAAHNQNCAAIRIDSSKFLPEFVYHSLRSRYEHNRNSGAGGVQPALNKQKVQRIELPVLTIGDQRDVVAEIEEFEDAHTHVMIAIDKASIRSAALRRSLLRAAFNGELVDQDPTDEPAEAALAKLRTAAKAPTGRRRKAVAAP